MAPPDPKSIAATPGSVRLVAAIPAVILTFFFSGLLDYALPLYFSALGEAARARGAAYPADLWSQLAKYQVTPWVVGPLVAGLCARRYGERNVWSLSLAGRVLVPLALLAEPKPELVPGIALWLGITGALGWIAAVSLIQMTPATGKGRANGWMMAGVGLGSLLGPVAGRFLIYRLELTSLAQSGAWDAFGSVLFSFSRPASTPQVADFHLIFQILAASTVVCGVFVWGWGQHPGRFEQVPIPDWGHTLQDLGRLFRVPRFWALAISLALLGGPVFQASNQFLPYLAEQLGLKNGSRDSGWIWLQLLKTVMWLPGGAAVGLLAGRRAPGMAGVLMVGSFALMAMGMGSSRLAWHLFAWVAAYEFVRQFMRWSHAGYLSEHMPAKLRSTAIGATIACSGIGSTVFGWVAGAAWDPTVESRAPFFAAALLGGLAACGLFLFDRFQPIREAEPTAD